VHKCFFKKQ